MIGPYLKQARDTFSNLAQHTDGQLTYVVEPTKWSVANDGQYITDHLNSQHTMSARLATTARGLRHTTVHFGALPTFLTAAGWRPVHSSNRVIVTAFHLANQAQTNLIVSASRHLTYILTTNSITQQALRHAGVPAIKLKQIPLGVDSNLFTPFTAPSRQAQRHKLNLPADKFIIGSFQKDGVGWAAGLTPKLIKGPDIFVQVVAQVARRHPVHVLLAGPARGYIAKALADHNISFTNVGYLHDFADLAPIYHALDCYLITSRIEGGPKQFLEAWASGIPVVSTSVGMIPDIATPAQNALIAQPDNPTKLAQHVLALIDQPNLGRSLSQQALTQINQYDWSHIAQEYHRQLYSFAQA